MRPSFRAILPHGRKITVTYEVEGLKLETLLVPWSNVVMMEATTPGEVELTTVAKNGDHVRILLRDAHVPVDDRLLGFLARPE